MGDECFISPSTLHCSFDCFFQIKFTVVKMHTCCSPFGLDMFCLYVWMHLSASIFFFQQPALAQLEVSIIRRTRKLCTPTWSRTFLATLTPCCNRTFLSFFLADAHCKQAAPKTHHSPLTTHPRDFLAFPFLRGRNVFILCEDTAPTLTPPPLRALVETRHQLVIRGATSFARCG